MFFFSNRGQIYFFFVQKVKTQKFTMSGTMRESREQTKKQIKKFAHHPPELADRESDPHRVGSTRYCIPRQKVWSRRAAHLRCRGRADIPIFPPSTTRRGPSTASVSSSCRLCSCLPASSSMAPPPVASNHLPWNLTPDDRPLAACRSPSPTNTACWHPCYTTAVLAQT